MRRLYDFENVKIFIKGSSSKILKEKLAKELRGRIIFHEMLPFSFEKFIRANGIKLIKDVIYGKLKTKTMR